MLPVTTASRSKSPFGESSQYLRAEEEFAEEDCAYLGGLVAQYHGGKYARELRGDGTLTLTSQPPGAEVWLHEQVEEGFALVDREGRQLKSELELTALA